ncbi:MAG: hypothetical protein NZM15_02890 [Flavobacteriales bacterium]|nr:hypothetical protein [Flavobacteriales bacterium]MDW8431632.1 hypothetical protein [Flavobacteriales bacterium]
MSSHINVNRRYLENAWDIFILFITTVNLLLILFDLSYLRLRPRYLATVPQLTRWYDPFKGIEPHQLTESFRILADSLYMKVHKGNWKPAAQELKEAGDSLFRISLKILQERPYERFGLMGYQERFKLEIKKYVQEKTGRRMSASEAFRWFWSLTPENAQQRLHYYNQHLRYYLLVNYYRHYNLSGGLVDHFWKLDLPFLLFFWLEFWLGWLAAVRLKRFDRWWKYPLAHWYDVLALTPIPALRIFRLLRIWNFYLRLRRTNVYDFSNSLLARILREQSHLIAKAIADAVALQTINQLKHRVEKGEEVVLLQKTLIELKPILANLAADNASLLLADTLDKNLFQRLLEESLIQALRPGLVALPGFAAETLENKIRSAARQALDKSFKNLILYFASEEGKLQIRDTVGDCVEALIGRLGEPQVQQQIQRLALIGLENLQNNFRN